MHSNEQTNVGFSGFIKFDSFKLPQSHLEDKIYPLVLRGFMIHTPTPNYPVFNLLMHLHSHIFSMGSYYFIYLIGYKLACLPDTSVQTPYITWHRAATLEAYLLYHGQLRDSLAIGHRIISTSLSAHVPFLYTYTTHTSTLRMTWEILPI